MREGEAVPGTVSRRVAGLQCLADCPKNSVEPHIV